MNNILDYYKNPDILGCIQYEMRFIKSKHDQEDCKQSIFAELYDFMPLDTEEASRLIRRVSRKFRRQTGKQYATTQEYRDYNDWDSLGDGNYQRKAHYGSAD